jgi:hypothetical protein
MRKRKSRLADLRSGQPILKADIPPAEWLIEAVGADVAWAAELFKAQAVELSEGVTIRLREGAKP